ncbi:RNA polymerase II mediator complex subunit [Lambiella insularis]|nr:RNA polymerase II mediator complex subunit [Lambiella insularis]
MDSSTSTLTNGRSVSLRAWPTSKRDEHTLSALLAQLTKEKRSFSALSEQDLEEELRAVNAGEAPQSDGEPPEDDDLSSPKTRKEKILTARAEILSHVAEAQSEASKALDFVSLLLSQHIPKQAEGSMSPHVKQHVPMGSLGAEVVQSPQKAESKHKDDGLVSTGWRLQSLGTTANALLASATRLEREMELEAKHWEQVLSVQAGGWSLCRLPQERHTLGVRYGFSEAAPEYRSKGLGGLRRSDDGNIHLDLGLNAPAPRVLRVRVMHKNRVVASSLGPDALDTGDDSIENAILQARNALYFDELYHEMYREARLMTNRGVRCMTDCIILPVDDERYLAIDLVPTRQDTPEEKEAAEHLTPQASTPQSSNRYLAKALSLATKVLLSYAHLQNYKRRTRLPPPLTERKPPRPVYSILKPLLALLQQQAALKQLERLFDDVRALFRAAGLDLTVNSPNSVLDLVAMLDSTPLAGTPLAETLAETISAPLRAQIHIALPSAASLQVHLHTHLRGPELRILIDAPPTSPLSEMPREMTLDSAAEIDVHVLHMLMCDLISIIEVQNRRWDITSLHEGELRTKPGIDGRFQILNVVLERGKLEIVCGRSSEEDEIIVERVEWTREMKDAPKLLDEVRTIGAEEVN